MKAVYVPDYGDADVLEYGDWDDPTPAADQLLIAVTTIPVNFADIHNRSGRYGRAKQPPFIPGMEAVGTVLAVGDGVQGFEVGQRVTAFSFDGAYSEKMLAPSVLSYALPDGVSDEDAASCVSAVTAYNMLTLIGALSRDDIVVIHSAAGGVGSFAIQIARTIGPKYIVATVGSDEKIELVRRLGADTVINYKRENFADMVLDLSEGVGATLILEARGGDNLNEDLRCLADFGRMVVYGYTSGASMQLDTGAMYKRNQSVLGYSSGHYRRTRPEVLRPGMERLLELFAAGDIHNIIGETFSLNEASTAHHLLESGQSTGKILLRP